MTTRASAKRKVNTQGKPCPEPGQNLLTPGGGKKARKSGCLDTPKRASTRKTLSKEESPNLAKRTGSLPVQGKVTPEGGNVDTKVEGTKVEKSEVNKGKRDEA